MSMLEHLKRMDFEVACHTSDGEVVKGTEEQLCILFNDLTISKEEVDELVRSGEYEYDSRIIVTSQIRANNFTCKGKDNSITSTEEE